LEIDSVTGDNELFAVLNSCRAPHTFHVNCIFTWAEQENSCPQCKRRFASVGVYSADGELVRVAKVEERDQNFEESDAEGSDEETVCRICQQSSDEGCMLLCDGQDGCCNAACHFYCIGLSEIPEGDWFCPSCQASQDACNARMTALDRAASDTSIGMGDAVAVSSPCFDAVPAAASPHSSRSSSGSPTRSSFPSAIRVKREKESPPRTVVEPAAHTPSHTATH